MARFQVEVGNIGTVYDGDDQNEALKIYGVYVSLSQSPSGRAAGENVALFDNGEPTYEYVGDLTREEPND